jgi:hypothetical protein
MIFSTYIPLFFTNLLSLKWRIFFTCLATIIVNLPFGYLRGGLQKLSVCWFVAIHAPVPLVILIRQFYGLELSWSLAPFLLGSFFIGQFLGRKLWSVWPLRKNQYSCAFNRFFN